MVPHLTTALTGPLQALEREILGALPTIEHWFRQQWQNHSAPFYTSVDLRNSGFKLAPVDTNLFPAGFNNLRPEFEPLCVQAVMSAVEKICPDTRQFLLIPENHTRNLFYLQNVAALKSILQRAGFAVRIGSLLPEITAPTPLTLPDGQTLVLEPVRRTGNRLSLDGFDPCAVLLNNDLSGGIPDVLKGLSQPVVPPLFAGWSTRRKSRHFAAYDRVATEFAALVGIDPWVINPYFSHCGHVDFADRQGLDCLSSQVEMLLAKIRDKYRELDIRDDPFLIIKADAGTYGMGIMTVKSPDDLQSLNRKQRNKMAVIKEGQAVREVLIQEGVYTYESVEGAVAEPVIYMIDHFVVGGFYRVHTERGINENLNAPGARFVPLAFETNAIAPDQSQDPDAMPNRFYTYGVVARLAMLAAALELEDMAATQEE
ncbi:MAG: glutamate--cysteine ligase [Betaproteobacteria bacterium]|nr:glutamate--cysteine ligase [Betaproteobacteria bacterium]